MVPVISLIHTNLKMNHTFWIALSLAFLSIQTYSVAQSDRFEPRVYKSADGDSLQYRLMIPDYNPIRDYPLVVFLHGSGERGEDNKAQLKWGIQQLASDNMMKNFPCFVLAPQCPANGWWSNYENLADGQLSLKPEAGQAMSLMIELVESLIIDLNIDTNRIYITGLSMGGYGTFDAIIRRPDLFAAAIPVCGGGDISQAKLIKDIPMWIITGSEDSVVDPKLSTDMLLELHKEGARPGFTLYPETGHYSWLAAYSDPMIWAWLFRQSR